MRKITIIGAGPVGCYLAYLLSKNNHNVLVVEEHKKIGLPVQCTGILTSKIKDIVEIKKSFLVNTIKKTRICSPKKRFLEVDIEDNYIVDRKKFDGYFYNLAKESNVKFILNSKFLDYDKKNKLVKIKTNNNIKQNKIKQIKTDILIGCDGPVSRVYKLINKKKRKYWLGLQTIARLKNDNSVEFYPWIKTYAWVVPENKRTVRIGLATKDKSAKKQFNRFLNHRLGVKKKIIALQSGLIPEYNPKIKFCKNNIYLAGDAALQVKATTGGGLIPGLLSARACAKSIIQKKDYNKELKKINGKNLKAHLYLRNLLNKFSDKDWESLIKTFQDPRLKEALKEYNRDSPIKLLIKLFLSKPSLIKYVRYIF